MGYPYLVRPVPGSSGVPRGTPWRSRLGYFTEGPGWGGCNFNLNFYNGNATGAPDHLRNFTLGWPSHVNLTCSAGRRSIPPGQPPYPTAKEHVPPGGNKGPGVQKQPRVQTRHRSTAGIRCVACSFGPGPLSWAARSCVHQHTPRRPGMPPVQNAEGPSEPNHARHVES
jgi:hypothetical protein